MNPGDALELVPGTSGWLQLGAFGLLGIIIVWAMRTFYPKLTDTFEKTMAEKIASSERTVKEILAAFREERTMERAAEDRRYDRLVATQDAILGELKASNLLMTYFIGLIHGAERGKEIEDFLKKVRGDPPPILRPDSG